MTSRIRRPYPLNGKKRGSPPCPGISRPPSLLTHSPPEAQSPHSLPAQQLERAGGVMSPSRREALRSTIRVLAGLTLFSSSSLALPDSASLRGLLSSAWRFFLTRIGSPRIDDSARRTSQIGTRSSNTRFGPWIPRSKTAAGYRVSDLVAHLEITSRYEPGGWVIVRVTRDGCGWTS